MDEQNSKKGIAIAAGALAAAVAIGTLSLVAGWHLGIRNAPTRFVDTTPGGFGGFTPSENSMIPPDAGGGSANVTDAAQTYIDIEAAKQTALTYAGTAGADEVLFTKARLDRDDGRMIYEIEYYIGTTEYAVDVDALTGTVVDVDIDYYERFD